jgi:hypothetical protein
MYMFFIEALFEYNFFIIDVFVFIQSIDLSFLHSVN